MTHPDTLQISRAVVEQALKRAYQLGQTYWQQADSDSWTQNKKSDETQVHFNALVTKTCEALQPQADTSVLQAAPWPPAGETLTEPEAMRYDFDGYGWKYIDNGSGSDWMTRHPEGEFLFTKPQAVAEPVNEWKEAVIEQLAAHSMDAPVSDSPTVILAKIIHMAVLQATDPAINKRPAAEPVAHILPRDLKILKFKSMPAPVDPLPYDNGEEKTVPLYTTPPAAQAEPVIPAGFALVPIRATAAMVEAFSEEGWEWANVLAAAEAVTEGEYEAALEGTPPATQAALTAASDCRTCQHLSEAWGVCEARPKCVGGEQYVYFPEKQLWDKTPRNDGQAAHQEMREALYAEFNRAVGRQHD